MRYTDANLRHCMASPLELFVPWRDANAKDGFRTVALSLCGDPGSTLIYSAVMVRQAHPFNGAAALRLDAGGMHDKLRELAAASTPLHPYLLAATGSRQRAVFAACFRPMATPTECDLFIAQRDHAAHMAARRAAGWMPLCIDSFGASDDIHYCVVWARNDEHVNWNAESVNDHGSERQQRSEAMAAIDATQACLTVTPDGGLARVFVDRRRAHSKAAYVGADLSQEIDAQRRENRHPVQIAAAVVDGAVRYAALFAESDEYLPRSLRVQGPPPKAADLAAHAAAARLDDWMKAYLQQRGIRGAALAVVKGTRLVYAKGFTWAEAAPHYPDVLPTTLFRQASVSKLFCALAVWRALVKRNAHAPQAAAGDTTLQSLLQLRKRDGKAPQAAFGTVTLRHLLECNSGIEQATVRSGTLYPNADGSAKPLLRQPLSRADIGHAVAAADMAGPVGGTDKGGRRITHYGHTDYILLGMAAAKMAGQATFEGALNCLLLDPLHMTRTRGGRSRIEDRASDDARQHVDGMPILKSAVHDDRRLVPEAYGRDNYEVYGGAGGLTSAVVDMARLAALLNLKDGHPLHTDFMCGALVGSAVFAKSQSGGPDSHCFYGFDDATLGDGQLTLSKGGGLPGACTRIWGTLGGLWFAIAFNGNDDVDDDASGHPDRPWKTELPRLAQAVKWSEKQESDLFPHFDMPSL